MSSRPSRGAARLAAILDALPDALLLVNANGTVVNANCIALDVFETPGTALIGRGLLDLLPAFDSKRIPGSMRRPDERVEQRQPPTRMMARRTDGNEFPVEVTSTNLEDGRTTYESSFEAAYADHGGYSGNELLMLVVRDLTGTLDTEAELARQQRQTEMILRAAAEGVIGTDTEGRVVLVNPSAAQILGYRASDLGGQALHPLVHHTRGDGSPQPYEETPLADTLRSGRKHRVRGQVLWSKSGERVPVDMTTAPVRDGDQLVGAVLTFTDRRRIDALEERHAQLLAVVDEALRGPLEELRGELTGLAADPAGQLWPEANQILHHLSAGHARMTTLIDNVVRYQRLDAGREKLNRRQVSLDAVITAGVESAVELIGPGRAQFAVHAPPIQAEVDAERLSLAIAHLVADVAGVDVTGHGVASNGLNDSTIVVAAAKRGGGDQGEEATQEAVVRIEVRGPHVGGSPVHLPIARGVVRKHGGVLQTHEVPGVAGGSAYVLEVPVGDVSDEPVPTPGAELELSRPHAEATPEAEAAHDADGAQGPEGADGAEPDADEMTPGNETTVMPLPEQPRRGTPGAHALPGGGQQPRPPGGFALPAGPTTDADRAHAAQDRPDPQEVSHGQDGAGQSGTVALPPGQAETTPPGGVVPLPRAEAVPSTPTSTPPPTGRRARRALQPVEDHAPQAAELGAQQPGGGQPGEAFPTPPEDAEGVTAVPGVSETGGDICGEAPPSPQIPAQVAPGTGRRGRRAKPPVDQDAESGPMRADGAEEAAYALPPGATGRGEEAVGQYGEHTQGGRPDRPTGRRRKPSPAPEQLPQTAPQVPDQPLPPEQSGAANDVAAAHHAGGGAPEAPPAAAEAVPGDAQGGQLPHVEDMDPRAAGHAVVARSPILGGAVPPHAEPPRAKPLPMPGSNPQSDPGNAVSVRTLGQGRPYAAQVAAHAEAQAAQAEAHAAQAEAQAAQAEAQAAPPARQAPQQAPHQQIPQTRQTQDAGPPPAPGADQAGGQTSGHPPGHTPMAPSPQAGQAPHPGQAPQAQPGQAPPARPGLPQVGRSAPPAPQARAQQTPPGGTGRRRKLAAPPEEGQRSSPAPEQPATQRSTGQYGGPYPTGPRPSGEHPHGEHASAQHELSSASPQQHQAQPALRMQPPRPGVPQPSPQSAPPPRQLGAGAMSGHQVGRQFTVSAPDAEADEGPEPLDGPGGATEITQPDMSSPAHPIDVDDELPPEPLDNPRRLLVWPEPDVSTRHALTERGYRPVLVQSRDEVNAQIAAYPAALFVDPLTGPITRTALQSLRQAAVTAEVPVLVTAGLGQASREAAYGADPAVLLKALAPRDSEQHPPRVLLVEGEQTIAQAFAATLERRGMQVAIAGSDSEAANVAAQIRPNLVVMDLAQIRRRRAGVIDWLRVNGLLHRTPFVVYTSAGMDQDQLAQLSAGETVLFLAERSTSQEVQARLVDLLAKIDAR